MATAKLIVCERSGSWAAALRREIGAFGLRVHETRSLAECWDELRLAPASLLMCEATGANVAAVCEFLTRLARWRTDARAVVVANPDALEFADVFGEAGAIHVVTSLRDLRTVALLAQRHFQRFPTEDNSLRTQIWSRLPWPESPSAGVAEVKNHRPLSK